MEAIFEEVDFQSTPLGDICLRKRSEPRLNNLLVYEVKLNDEFLMSSLFVEGEEQLSLLALDNLRQRGRDEDLNLIVGGLGLGYTALAALNNPAVKSLEVIEVLPAVIDWHQRGILPIGNVLATSARCTLTEANFFELAQSESNSFGKKSRVDAVLLDIDHSPSHWLNEQNAGFYSRESLQKLADKIAPQGVFGLWSNELPDANFTTRLADVFDDVMTHNIWFHNPYTGGESSNSIYLAIKS